MQVSVRIGWRKFLHALKKLPARNFEARRLSGRAVASMTSAGRSHTDVLHKAIQTYLEDVDAPDLTNAWSAGRLARESSLRPAVKQAASLVFPNEAFYDGKASEKNNPGLVRFCATHFPNKPAGPSTSVAKRKREELDQDHAEEVLVANSGDEDNLAEPDRHGGGADSSGVNTREQREIRLKPSARGPVSATVGATPNQSLDQHVKEADDKVKSLLHRAEQEVGLKLNASLEKPLLASPVLMALDALQFREIAANGGKLEFPKAGASMQRLCAILSTAEHKIVPDLFGDPQAREQVRLVMLNAGYRSVGPRVFKKHGGCISIGTERTCLGSSTRCPRARPSPPSQHLAGHQHRPSRRASPGRAQPSSFGPSVQHAWSL